MHFPPLPTGRVLVALALLVCTSVRAAAHPPADSFDADATSWYAFPTVFYTPEMQEEEFTSRYADVILQTEQQVGVAWRVVLRGRMQREAVTKVEASGPLCMRGYLEGHFRDTVHATAQGRPLHHRRAIRFEAQSRRRK